MSYLLARVETEKVHVLTTNEIQGVPDAHGRHLSFEPIPLGESDRASDLQVV